MSDPAPSQDWLQQVDAAADRFAAAAVELRDQVRATAEEMRTRGDIIDEMLRHSRRSGAPNAGQARPWSDDPIGGAVIGLYDANGPIGHRISRPDIGEITELMRQDIPGSVMALAKMIDEIIEGKRSDQHEKSRQQERV